MVRGAGRYCVSRLERERNEGVDGDDEDDNEGADEEGEDDIDD